MAWGHRRLQQFANITAAADDDSVENEDQEENSALNYDELDKKAISDVNNMMEELSIQGCTPRQQENYVSRYISSMLSELSNLQSDRKRKEKEERERLAAEARKVEEEAAEAKEKEERERLIAPWEEAYNKQASKAAAEAKEAEERIRFATEAEKEEKERRVRLSAGREEKERERLAAEVEKEEEERITIKSQKGGRKARSLPLDTVEYLKAWMMSPEHIAHPYPTKQEKAQIQRLV